MGSRGIKAIVATVGVLTLASVGRRCPPGLVFGTVAYSTDYTCTNVGLVLSQSPAARTQVNHGSAVSVRIGAAPRPPRECP